MTLAGIAPHNESVMIGFGHIIPLRYLASRHRTFLLAAA